MHVREDAYVCKVVAPVCPALCECVAVRTGLGELSLLVGGLRWNPFLSSLLRPIAWEVDAVGRGPSVEPVPLLTS